MLWTIKELIILSRKMSALYVNVEAAWQQLRNET